MSKGFSIAIDGPIASGKSTVATALADELEGLFMSTGNMYRAVALLCLEKNLDINNEKDVEKVLPNINVDYAGKNFFLNGIDITDRIRLPDISHGSSVVAVYAKVRNDLVAKQQQIANRYISHGKIVIADGRDTGTRVIPDAFLKIFLTATPAIRAERSLERYKTGGVNKTLEDVIEEIKLRDERDINRKIDPLPSRPEKMGYWILDDSGQTKEQTINAIIKKLKERGLIND